MISQQVSANRSDNVKIGGRSRIVLAVLLLALIFPTVGCGGKNKTGSKGESSVSWHDYLGPESYLDDIVALTWEGDEDGVVGVRHRYVEDLEGLVGGAGVPVVVIFYDHLAEHAHHLMADAESLAEHYRSKACILLVTPDADVPLFDSFQRQLLPTTYFIWQGSGQGFVQGWNREVVNSIRDFIEEHQERS